MITEISRTSFWVWAHAPGAEPARRAPCGQARTRFTQGLGHRDPVTTGPRSPAAQGLARHVALREQKPPPPLPLRTRFAATEPAPPPEKKTLAPPQGRRVAGLQAVDAPLGAPALPARPALQDRFFGLNSTAAPTGAANLRRAVARSLGASQFLRDEVPDIGPTWPSSPESTTSAASRGPVPRRRSPRGLWLSQADA